MNFTRSTRKSKIKNLAKVNAMRKKLTLSVVSILSCISILFVGGVASTVDPTVDIDNPITYTSDIAFEKSPEGVEFYIRTYQDLQVLANLVSANAVITGTDINYSTATYTVLNNISNENGDTMNPIGTTSSPFKGTFNGNGYTISGLKVAGESAVGFFGATDGATISGVRIESGSITATGNIAGGLIGSATNTTITQSYNKANVTGVNQVGGLVGVLTNSTITENANLGNVTGESELGGLVGRATTTDGETIISTCFNAGNVSGNELLGGMVGVGNNISLTGSYSVAKLNGNGGTILGSSTNTNLQGVYFLENMGGAPTTDAIGLSGEDMSNHDAISAGKMGNLDISYWATVENEDGIYNLPELKTIEENISLRRIIYHENNGVMPEDKSSYTIYFKQNDTIVLPSPTRSGFAFGGWVNDDGSKITADMVSESISLTATWNVLQPEVSIINSDADDKRIYGENSTLSAVYETFDGIEYQVEWFLGDTSVGSANDLLLQQTQGVGTYTYKVVLTATADDQIVTAYAEKTVIVEKKALTITAVPSDVVYGSSDAEFKSSFLVEYSGFVNGETKEYLSGELTYLVSGNGVIDSQEYSRLLVGDYTLNLSGFTSDNYAITYVAGEFKITKRNVVIIAGSATQIYNGLPLTSNEYTTEGLVNHDEINESSLTFVGTITNVGEETNSVSATGVIILNNETDVTNCYEISYQTGTLTITPLEIVVTANGEMTYGESSPQYTLDFAGTDWGVEDSSELRAEIESLITVSIEQSVDIQNLLVGTHSGIVILSATSDNHTFVFTNGDLVVNQREITITIGDYTGVYDGLSHSVGYEITTGSLANGDREFATLNSITNVGSKDAEFTSLVIKKGETDVTDCYKITIINGALSVTKAPLTITVNLSKNEMFYGDEVPTLSVSYSGFVNGEDHNVLIGEITYISEYLDGDKILDGIIVGTYEFGVTGLDADNYVINYVSAQLIVKTATLEPTIEWDKTNLGTVNWTCDNIGPNTINAHAYSFTLILTKGGVEVTRVTYNYSENVYSHDFSEIIKSSGAGTYVVSLTATSNNDNILSATVSTDELTARKVTLIKGDEGIANVVFADQSITTQIDEDDNLFAIIIYGQEERITITVVSTLANLVGGYTFNEWTVDGVDSLTHNNSAVSLNTATLTFDLPDTDITLTATSTVTNVYTVTIDTDGGKLENFTSPIEYKVNQTITLPTIDNITKTGYTFSHFIVSGKSGIPADNDLASWFIGTRLEGGQTLPAGNYGNVTIKAVYTANKYLVIFDAPNGSVNPTDKSVTFGSSYGELPTPTRDGYDFAGWFTSATAGEEVTAETEVTTAEDHIIYAHWTTRDDTTYTIEHYKENIGNKTSDDLDKYTLFETTTHIGATETSPAIISKTYTGFTFNGDYTVMNYTTIMGDGSTVVKLYYTRNEFTLTLVAGTGISEVTGAGIYDYEQEVEISAVVSAGYTWNTWISNIANFAELEFELTLNLRQQTIVIGLSNITLTATATANSYTVKYDRNKPETAITEISGTTANSTHIYNEDKALSTNGYVLPGWDFVGWATEPEGVKVYSDKQTVKNLTAENDGVVTLYAVWTLAEYTVTFDGNGGTPSQENKTVKHNQPYGDLPTAVLGGYTFIGWFTAINGGTQVTATTNYTLTEDQTLYAHYQANTYNIIYVIDGVQSTAGRYTTSTTAQEFEITNPETDGFTYGDWVISWTNAEHSDTLPELDGTTLNILANTYGNITLTTTSTANGYIVSFDPNGGEETPENKTVIYEQAYGELPTTISRTGYIFAGWYTSADGGLEITKTTIVTTAENHTLYAHWTAIIYTVSYDSNKPNGASSTISGVTGNSTHTYDVEKALTTNGYTLTGYTFLGWSTNKNATSATYTNAQVVKNLTTTDRATVTLYAVWQANTYTVIVTPADGSSWANGTTSSFDATYDQVVTVIAPTRNGYTIFSWISDVSAGYMGATAEDVTTAVDFSAIKTYTYYFKNLATSGTVEIELAYTLNAPEFDITGTGDVTYGDGKTITPTITNKVDGLTYAITYSAYDQTYASVSGSNLVYAKTTPVASYSANVIVTVSDSHGNTAKSTTELVSFSVNKKQLTVTLDPTSATVTYGESAEFTITFAGFVNGETVANLSGTLADTKHGSNITRNGNEYEVTTKNTLTAGTYTIAVSGLSSDNYSFTIGEFTLTVGTKEITITADSTSKVYDGTPLSLNSATASGLVNGDKLDTLTLVTTGSQTVVGTGTNTVTTYKIVTSNGGSDVTSSYLVTLKTGTLTVTARAITVVADNRSKEYDGTALVPNSYTITSGSLAPNQSISAVTYDGSQTNVGSSTGKVKSITIVDSNSNNVTSNYAITYGTTGTLTVTKATFNPSIAWSETTAGLLTWSCPSIGGKAPTNYTIVLKRTPNGSTTGTTITTVTATGTSYNFADLIKQTGNGEYEVTLTANTPDTTNINSKSVTTNPNLFAYTITLVKNDPGIASVNFVGTGLYVTTKVVDKSAGIESTALPISEMSANGLVMSATNPAANSFLTYTLNGLTVGTQYTLNYIVSGTNSSLGKISVDVYNGATKVSSDVTTFTVQSGYTYKIKFYTNAGSSAYSGTTNIIYSAITLNNRTSLINMFDFFTYISQATYIYGTGNSVEAISTPSEVEDELYGGYSFDEWQVRPEGVTLSFLDDTTENSSNIKFEVPNVDVFLYSVSKVAGKYNITYNANGGTISGTYTTEYARNDAITLPSSVTKTGYTFGGWTLTSVTAKSGEESVTGNKDFLNFYSVGDTFTTGQVLPEGQSKSGQVTFTAQWTPNIYKVTFDKQSGIGGTSEMWYKFNTYTDPYFYYSNASCTTGIADQKITIPTRTGYTFGGYFPQTDGKGTMYVNTVGICINSLYAVYANNVTLYAYWIPNTYTITFDANGGTGTMSDIIASYDKAINLTTNAFTRTEHQFLGWSTSSTATTATYTDGQSVLNLATSGTVALYAVWKINSYTITIQSGSYNITTAVNVTLSIEDGNGNIIKQSDGTTAQKVLTSANRTGTFTLNYSTDVYTIRLSESGSRSYVIWIYYDGAYKTNGSTGNISWTGMVVDGDHTIRWLISELYSVSTTIGTDGISSAEFMYTKWDTGEEIGPYTSIIDGVMQYSGIEMTAEIEDGYEFDGWYDGTTKVSSSAIYSFSISADSRFVAKATANKYTVSLDMQGGTGGTASVQATYNSAMPSITIPTKSGYNFSGYYTATNGGGTQYYTSTGASARTWNIANNTTLYAYWTPKTVNLRYENANENACTISADTLAVTSAKVGDTITLSFTTKEGFWAYRWYICTTSGTELSYVSNDSTYTITEEDGDREALALLAMPAYKWDKSAVTNFVDRDDTGGQISGEWNIGSWYDYLDNGMQANASCTIYAKPKTGYSFYGWFLRVLPTVSNYNTGIALVLASDCTYTNGYYSYTHDPNTINPYDGYMGGGTFYALFLPNDVTYTVNHYLMDTSGNYPSTATKTETKTGKYNQTLTLSNLKDTSSTFNVSGGIGYHHAEVGGSTVTTVTLGSSAVTINLYYARSLYTLNIDPNGGIRDDGYAGVVILSRYYGWTESLNARTRTGYTLTGYTSSVSGVTVTLNSSTKQGTCVMPASDLTLTAQWQANDYTLTFNPNGGTVGTTSTTMTYDSKLTNIPTPTRPGYNLLGWSLVLNPSSVNYFEPTSFIDNSAVSSASGAYSPSNTSYWACKDIIPLTNVGSATFSLFSMDGIYLYCYDKDGNYLGYTGGTSKTIHVGTVGIRFDISKSKIPYANVYPNNTTIYTGNSNGFNSNFIYSTNSTCLWTSNTTLYAVWQEATFTLTFNANGGTTSTSSINNAYGSKISSVPTPTRTGYNFLGWSTVQNPSNINYLEPTSFVNNSAINSGTGEFALGYSDYYSTQFILPFTNVAASVPVTLYSNQAICGVYTFNSSGTFTGRQFSYTSSGNIPAGTIGLRLEVTKNHIPYESIYPTNTAYQLGLSSTFSSNFIYTNNSTFLWTGDTTLYAVWTPAQYTVSYDANGGTGTMSSTTVTYGQSYTCPENGFTRDGYSFTKWTASDDSNWDGWIGRPWTWTFTYDLTLSANWCANVVCITLDKNGGTGGTDKLYYRYNTADGYWLSYSNGTFSDGTTTLEMPTKTGYIINRYYLASVKNANGELISIGNDGETYAYNNGQMAISGDLYTDVFGTVTSAGYAEATLIAEWIVKSGLTVNINHYVMNTSGSYPSTATKTTSTTASYGDTITLANLKDSSLEVTNGIAYNYGTANGTTVTSTTMTDGTLTINLYYKRYQYVATFDSNGGYRVSDGATGALPYTYYYGYVDTIVERARTGYTFTGWNLSVETTFTQISGTQRYQLTIPASNITLTAQWTANTYNVTLDPNGGSASSTSTTVKYDGKYGTLPTPTRTGYTFVGWGHTSFTNPEMIVANWSIVNHGEFTTMTQFNNETINGVANQSYMRFTANGLGTDTAVQIHSYNSMSVTAGETYTLSWYTRSNVTSAQWASAVSGWETYIEWSDGTKSYLPATLYFTGDGNWHRVFASFTAPSGVTTARVRLGTDYPNFATGQYIDVSSVKFEKGSQVSDYVVSSSTTCNIAFDHTLTAIWRANKVTLTLDKGIGSGGTTNIYYYYNTNTFYSDSACTTVITSYTIPTAPTGYTFTHYYGDGSAGGSNGERYLYKEGTFAGDLYCDIYKDATLYALYTANSYTLTFNPNGGTVGTTSTTMTYDSKLTNIPTPTRTGYNFLGWATVLNPSNINYMEPTSFIDNSAVSSASGAYSPSNTSYWACKDIIPLTNVGGVAFSLYSMNGIYLYCYDKDGNYLGYTGGTSKTIHVGTVGIRFDIAKATIPYANVSPTNTSVYTGNSNGFNSNFIYSTNSTCKWTSNTTLYAVWTPAQYTVTYNANGGTTGETSATKTYNSKFASVPTPTRTGYSFLGWATVLNPGDVNYMEPTSFVDGYCVSSSTGTYYANSAWFATEFLMPFTNISTSIPISIVSNRGINMYYYRSDGTYNTYQTGTSHSIPVGTAYIRLEISKNYIGYNEVSPSNTTIQLGLSSTFNSNFIYSANSTYQWASNKTLYAVWKPVEDVVTFDATGGSVSTTSKNVSYNSTYGTLPTPTRTGYTFHGWTTNLITNPYIHVLNWTLYDHNGYTKTTLYTDATINGQTVPYYRNTTVTANVDNATKLIQVGTTPVTGGKTYTLSWYVRSNWNFYFSSAASTWETQILWSDGTISYLPANLNVTGDGEWHLVSATFTAPSGVTTAKVHIQQDTPNRTSTSQYIDIANVQLTEGTILNDFYITSSSTVKLLTNHTLYAVWTPNTYKVTYVDVDGTTEILDPEYVIYGTSYVCPDCPITWNGYTFSYWTDSNGGDWNGWVGKAWTWTYTSDTVLKANRTANTITLTLNPSPGSGGTTKIYYKYQGPERPSTAYYYSDSACTNRITSITMPTRTGYTFRSYVCASKTGVSIGNDGEVYIYGYGWDGSTAGTLAGDLCSDIYADCTLTAVWFVKSGLTVNINHYVMNTSGSYPSTATKTTSTTASYGDTITLANLKDSSLEVTNGIAYYYGTANGTTVTSTTMPDGTLTINLYYKRSQYTMTIDPNGGYRVSDGATGALQFTYYYGYYETITERRYDGSTLTGWDSSVSGTTVTFNSTAKTGTVTMPACNLTITAKWSANLITLTLDPSPGSGGTTKIYYKYKTNKFYSDADLNNVITSITKPTRTGYTYVQYNGDGTSGGNNPERYIYSDGTFADDLYYDIYKDATLYAAWSPNQYTVTYNANGGSGTMSPTTVTYGQSYTCPENGFTRAGYTFTKWTASDGSNWDSWIGRPWTWALDHDITLYANWSANSYTLTYNANGGSVGTTSATMTYDSKLTGVPVPTRTGYNFLGWSTVQNPSNINYLEPTSFVNNSAINSGTGEFALGYSDYYSTQFILPFTNVAASVPVTLYSNQAICGVYTFNSSGTFTGRQFSYTSSGNIPAGTIGLRLEVTKNHIPYESIYPTNTAYQLGLSSTFSSNFIYTNNSTCKWTSNTTLYAVWKKAEYQFTFNYNIPSALRGTADQPTITITGKYGDSVADGTVIKVNEVPFESVGDVLNGANLAGYIFKWWTTTDPNSSNNYLINQLWNFSPTYATLNNTVDANLAVFNGDKIFYAEYYELLARYTGYYDDSYYSSYPVSNNYLIQNQYDLIWLSRNSTIEYTGYLITEDFEISENFTYYTGTANTKYTLNSSATTISYSTIRALNYSDIMGVIYYSTYGSRLVTANDYITNRHRIITFTSTSPVNLNDAGLVYSAYRSRITHITLDFGKLSISATDTDYVGGVVAYAEDSFINNIIVNNLTINASAIFIGGIAGYFYNWYVADYARSSCTVSDVTIKSYGGNVGGVYGNFDTEFYRATVYGYVSNLTITNSATTKGTPYIGGVIGYGYGGDYKVYCTVQVTDSTIESTATSGYCMIGGAVGYLSYGEINVDTISGVTVKSASTTAGEYNSTGGVVGKTGPVCYIYGDYENYHNLFDIDEFGDSLYGASVGASLSDMTVSGISTGNGTSSYDKNTKTLTMKTTLSGVDCYLDTYYSGTFTYLVEVAPSTTYTFSWYQNDTSDTWGDYSRPMVFYWSTATSGVDLEQADGGWSGKTYDSATGRYYMQFTTPANCNYISFRFGICDATTYGSISFSKIRLARGSYSSTTITYTENPTYNITNTTVTGSQKVGGVVGYMTSYCQVYNMMIDSATITGLADVGGVVGNCYSTRGTYASAVAIVRHGYGDPSHVTSIEWCQVTNSKITATSYIDAYTKTSTNAAGQTVRMYNYASSYYGSFVGGIVGYMHKGTLIACDSIGNTITGKNSGIGGIAGGTMNVDTVDYCMSKNGSIVSTATTSSGVNGCLGIGGIVGWWCHYRATFNQTDNLKYDMGVSRCTNYISLSGYFGVGGIIGYASGTITGATAWTIDTYQFLISQCNNHGDITCTSSAVGGLLGLGETSYVRLPDNGNTGVVTGINFESGGWVGNLSDGHLGYGFTTGKLLGYNDMGAICGYAYNLIVDGIYYYDSCGGTTEFGTAKSLSYICNDFELTPGFFRKFGTSNSTRGYFTPQLVRARGDRNIRATETDAFSYYKTTTGSDKKHFWIRTNAEIDMLRTLISQQACCTNGQLYSKQAYYFYPSETITVTSPIASDSNPFMGTFQGYNNTNRAVTLNISGGDYVSMFGALKDNATVSYLSITGSVTGESYVGAVAGKVINSTITQISNSATITGTGSYIGGIAGRLTSSSKVTSCTNNAIVSGDASTAKQVGGLVGELYSSSITSSSNGSNGKVTGMNDIGGVVGRALSGSNIDQCNNSASITGAISVGGIAGSIQSNAAIYGTSSNMVTNSGAVSGYIYVGGISGYIVTESKTRYAIQYAYNTATVSCRGYNSSYNSTWGKSFEYVPPGTPVHTTIGSGNYAAYIGGIGGYLSASSIRDVKNNKSVTVTASTCPTLNLSHTSDWYGSFAGNWQVYVTINSGALVGFGGIAGGLFNGSVIATSTIGANITVGFSSYAFTQTYGVAMVGGFVGYMDGGSMLGAVPTSAVGPIYMAVNGCDYTVIINGSYFLGGIVGYATGNQTQVSINGILTEDAAGNLYFFGEYKTSPYYNIIASVTTVNITCNNPSDDYENFKSNNDKIEKSTASPNTGIGCMSNSPYYYTHVGGGDCNDVAFTNAGSQSG